MSKKSNLRKLWRETFGDSEEYLDIIFNNLYDPAYALVCDGDGRLQTDVSEDVPAAGMVGIPYEFIDSETGTTYSALYLCGLATRPAERRKGLMERLLKQMDDLAAAAGFDFLFLIPADDHLRNYYSKFGYESGINRRRLSVPIGKMTGLLSSRRLRGRDTEKKDGETTSSKYGITPVYNKEYLCLARKEAELSGSLLLEDIDTGTEMFLEFTDENRRFARIRYFKLNDVSSANKLISQIPKNINQIELLLPTTHPIWNKIEDVGEMEFYGMIKPLYENPKFPKSDTIARKKSILAKSAVSIFLMLD